jgi:hypothetical protein
MGQELVGDISQKQHTDSELFVRAMRCPVAVQCGSVFFKIFNALQPKWVSFNFLLLVIASLEMLNWSWELDRSHADAVDEYCGMLSTKFAFSVDETLPGAETRLTSRFHRPANSCSHRTGSLILTDVKLLPYTTLATWMLSHTGE